MRAIRLIVSLLILSLGLAGHVLAQEPMAGSPAQVAAPPLDLKPDSSGSVPPEQIRELLRRAEEKDLENDKQLRDYTYVQREEEHKLDGHGAVKSVEIRTSEVMEIYGEQLQKLISKDDKPLSESDAKKEEEKIQKVIDKGKNESENDRRKRLERQEKDREEDRKFVLEVADAFNFRLIESEVIAGRDTWVLEGDPRPGFEPKTREAKMLTKFKGRVWIDKAAEQWVKLDITAIDTLSVGFVLARIHKGTRVIVELTKVNDEVWLPKHVQVHLDARIALFKSYDIDADQTYRDYKKFRTKSTITVIGEEK
jgi:primosomal protein N'